MICVLDNLVERMTINSFHQTIVTGPISRTWKNSADKFGGALCGLNVLLALLRDSQSGRSLPPSSELATCPCKFYRVNSDVFRP